METADYLNNFLGRSIVEWHQGKDGYHFVMDDGQTLILIGFIGVLLPEENVFH